MEISKYQIQPKSTVDLTKRPTRPIGEEISRKKGEHLLRKNVEILTELQDKLYAQNNYAVLIVIQAMDTAGKDGVIKHVMSGLNPQGTQVHSFKAPSEEELDHDYLWRICQHLPARGNIGIFNRSHYEEVLVVRVHELIHKQGIPNKLISPDIWEQRYQQINNFEKYLEENGIQVLKFFLHLSKEEQKQRLLERIDNPKKNWKFSAADVKERKFWSEYQTYYETVIQQTSTNHAPWYVIPADEKWYTRYMVSEIIVQQLKKLHLSYPKLEPEQTNMLSVYKKQLLEEED
ncbi:MAG: polyphosphate kinase 2 family protein [Marinifilaceae bacterium]